MLRPQGRGRRERLAGALACLMIAAGLALGGSALGSSNTISTVAGDGSGSFAGDGGPATLASLYSPEGVSATLDGGFLIADKDNNRIRRVAPDGTITTVAGTGTAGYNGDGVAATSAKLKNPEGVAALPDGGLLIADTGNCRIRRVSPLGNIETVAGTGSAGYSGDGMLATASNVNGPRAAVPTLDGGFLIADTENRRVRRVSPLGIISTVAGTGSGGSDGDGGPAVDADLGYPDDVAPTVDGGFLIADSGEHVVRAVSPLGTISTVAGSKSESGSAGNGGPATEAQLNEPADVEPLPAGGFLIADHGNDQVRHVRADGSIVPFAGSSSGGGFAGDGGPAEAARLDGPHGLSIRLGGDVLIADGHNNRVRMVDADFVLPPAAKDPAPPPAEERPSAEPTPDAEPAPEPVKGVSVTLTPGFGRVLVKAPGRQGFVPLEEGSSLPVGSTVDVRKGSVLLESALGQGRSQTGTFWAGIFQVRQARAGNGMTDIVLRGGSFRHCRHASRAPRSAISSGRRRPPRRLWAKDDNGRFRTHGRDSVATTRGTFWSTEDRCAGTVTRVREGQVLVRRRDSRKAVLVSAGERYLARSQP